MTNIGVPKSNPINIMLSPRNKLKSYLHSAPTVPSVLGQTYNKIPRKYYRLQSKQPHDLMKQGSKYPIHQQLKLKSHKHQGQQQLSSHIPPLGHLQRWLWYEQQSKSAKGLHIGPMTRQKAIKYKPNVKWEVHIGQPDRSKQQGRQYQGHHVHHYWKHHHPQQLTHNVEQSQQPQHGPKLGERSARFIVVMGKAKCPAYAGRQQGQARAAGFYHRHGNLACHINAQNTFHRFAPLKSNDISDKECIELSNVHNCYHPQVWKDTSLSQSHPDERILGIFEILPPSFTTSMESYRVKAFHHNDDGDDDMLLHQSSNCHPHRAPWGLLSMAVNDDNLLLLYAKDYGKLGRFPTSQSKPSDHDVVFGNADKFSNESCRWKESRIEWLLQLEKQEQEKEHKIPSSC